MPILRIGIIGYGGGDEALAWDFLRAMRDGRPSRAPIEAGILSALPCRKARESCADGTFARIDEDVLKKEYAP